MSQKNGHEEHPRLIKVEEITGGCGGVGGRRKQEMEEKNRRPVNACSVPWAVSLSLFSPVILRQPNEVDPSVNGEPVPGNFSDLVKIKQLANTNKRDLGSSLHPKSSDFHYIRIKIM